jgi:hypothetical protein
MWAALAGAQPLLSSKNCWAECVASPGAHRRCPIFCRCCMHDMAYMFCFIADTMINCAVSIPLQRTNVQIGAVLLQFLQETTYRESSWP